MPADKAMELQPGAYAHGLRYRAGLPATTHGRDGEEGADPRTSGAKPAFATVRDTRVNAYIRTNVHDAVRDALCGAVALSNMVATAEPANVVPDYTRPGKHLTAGIAVRLANGRPSPRPQPTTTPPPPAARQATLPSVRIKNRYSCSGTIQPILVWRMHQASTKGASPLPGQLDATGIG